MIVNAEKALIGALMMNPKEIKSCGSLRADMFLDAFLGRVYMEFLRAYDFGYSINLVTLASKLADIPQAEIMDRMKECADSSVSSAAAGEYAAVIHAEYKAREAGRIINSLQFHPAAIDRQIGELINQLDALREEERQRAKSLGQIVDEASPSYFIEREKPKICTGFSRLDDCLGGLEGGDVIVIGARPAVGKSAFVTQIIMQMSGQGKRILMFNLEMADAQVYERMLSRVSGLRLNRIRRAKAFLNDERYRFEMANESLKNLDIWISSGAKSVSEIRAESRNMGADCIVIDYLQLIRADRRYNNRASEVGDISKAIKALAMELNRPIILLSQLNRASELRETREPTMAELRESGDIEQDASVIILLWNVSEDDPDQKGLKVEKNRQGQRAKIRLEFLGDMMTFRELETADFNFKPSEENPFSGRE